MIDCIIGISFPMSSMSPIYRTKKIITLPLIFLYTHGSSIFDKVKHFDYLIRNWSTYSSMPAWIHKCIYLLTRDKLSRWYMAIAKKKIQIDIPDSNPLGHTHRCFNHSPYLVDVHRVHFEYHSFKPTVRVSTHDNLQIGQKNIIHNNIWCIVILNDKPIFEWYITHSDWPSVRRCVSWSCLINEHIWLRINLWTLHRLW